MRRARTAASFRIDVELLAELKRVADERVVGPNVIVENALRHYLPLLEASPMFRTEAP